MEAERIIEGTGIKDVYEEGSGCTVAKKDNKSNDLIQKWQVSGKLQKYLSTAVIYLVSVTIILPNKL